MGVFDDIKTGLEQAIAYEKGKLAANKTTLTAAPTKRRTASENNSPDATNTAIPNHPAHRK